MNLKEALDYRRNCIIHGLPLKAVFQKPYFPNNIEVGDNSLLVLSPKKSCWMRFGFNDTFIRTSDCPKSVDSTLSIYMMCEMCSKIPIRLSSMLGATSLNNILDTQHYYTILLTGGYNNKYVTELKGEEIRYHVNGKFYHVGVDLQTKYAACTIGSCDLGYKFDDILRGLSIIKIPTFNIEKIQNIEQYVDKLKLYNLFS